MTDECIAEMFEQYVADMVKDEPDITLEEYKGILGIEEGR